MIRVVDKATGEYIEFDYQSEDDLLTQYKEVSEHIKALERAKFKMRTEVDKLLGAEDKLVTSDYEVIREHRTYKSYDKTTLAQYLDADQMDLILQPNKTLTDELLADLVIAEALSPSDKKDIEANMLHTGGYDALKVNKRNR